MRASLPALAGALVLALAAAGCGGGSPNETAGAPSSSALSVPGGGLTVAEALASTLDEPLAVTGYLLEQGGELRLCTAILESYPPQCGQPSLRVRGAVARSRIGEQVTLVGEVAGGVLTVSETTKA
jgi:hypothetical protein